MDGNVSISHRSSQTVPIIDLNGIASLGVPLRPLATTMIQNCIGQTFKITQVGGIDITSFLIPVDAWYDPTYTGEKRIGLFVSGSTPWLKMSTGFFTHDCTLTTDGLFYRYTLGHSWHLDSGVFYDLVSTCHDLDAVMKRPVAFVYDPIITVLSISTFRQVNGYPSNQWGDKVYPGEQQDLYFHIGFEFPRLLPDDSVLTVGDIALRSLGNQSVSQTFRRLNQLFNMTVYPLDRQSQASYPHQPIVEISYWRPIFYPNVTPLPGLVVDLLTSPSLFSYNPSVHAQSSEVVYRPTAGPLLGECVFEVDAELHILPMRIISVAITLTQMDDSRNEYDQQIVNCVTYENSAALQANNRWVFNGPITNIVRNPLATFTLIQLSIISRYASDDHTPTVIITHQTPIRFRVSLISPVII